MERLRNGEEEPGGYVRTAFGDRAPTAAVRQAVLRAEMRSDGQWFSLWDGRIHSDPDDLDIDHTVALAEAWSSGAKYWTQEKRVAFANDLSRPYTLNAITDTLNRQKSDMDPFDWMPPLESSRCRYVREWVSVKLDWNLSADGHEKLALHNYAMECQE